MKAPIKSWQTTAPILTPEFGQMVRYYYNGAIIQYELVARKNSGDKDQNNHPKEPVDHDNHQVAPTQNQKTTPKLTPNVSIPISMPIPTTDLKPVDQSVQPETVDSQQARAKSQTVEKSLNHRKIMS